MQTYRTVPTKEEHKNFFKRYGKYSPYIAIGVILSQILSGFTESGLIYSNVKDATLVFGLTTANVAAIFGAFVGVALIEIVGLRVALSGTVDAFLYKRWKGLDALFSIALVILSVVLIPSSFILSLQGSGQIVENLKERTEQQKTNVIKAEQSKEIAFVNDDFQQNKERINSTYAGLINSEIDKAKSDSIVKQQQYNFWLSKGSKYKTRINKALTELQAVQATKTANIAQLKQQQANELQTLQNRYEARKDNIENESTTTLTNNSKKLAIKSQAFKTGSKYIVIIAMCFSIFGIILQRIFAKGAGIQELAEADNFYYAPTLFSERLKLFKDHFQLKRRNRIAKKRENLPQLIPYASSLPIQDLSTLDRTVLQLKMSDQPTSQVLYLNKQIDQSTLVKSLSDQEKTEQEIKDLLEAAKALRNSDKTKAKVVELKAKEVIKLYLSRHGKNVSGEDVEQFKLKVVRHLNKPNDEPNPFIEYRQKIGFKSSANENRINENRMQQKSNLRSCVHCGTSYQYRHHKQKYCTDDCRIAAWESRTGKRLKKKPKK